jgi:hypothetical protein
VATEYLIDNRQSTEVITREFISVSWDSILACKVVVNVHRFCDFPVCALSNFRTRSTHDPEDDRIRRGGDPARTCRRAGRRSAAVTLYAARSRTSSCFRPGCYSIKLMTTTATTSVLHILVCIKARSRCRCLEARTYRSDDSRPFGDALSSLCAMARW